MPRIVAADSKTLDQMEDAQLGDREPPTDVRRGRGECLCLKGMRRGYILVLIVVSRVVLSFSHPGFLDSNTGWQFTIAHSMPTTLSTFLSEGAVDNMLHVTEYRHKKQCSSPSVRSVSVVKHIREKSSHWLLETRTL